MGWRIAFLIGGATGLASFVIRRRLHESAEFEALRGADIPFRVVADAVNLDAASATVQTDLSIVACLESAVPDGISILGREAGLPDLPPFTIALHRSRTGLSPAADVLARGIREAFASRVRVAA